MTTSGSGAFYAFGQDSGAWVLKKIDTEDEAFSLCTHESKYMFLAKRFFSCDIIQYCLLDTDLQCDFNSPYWEDLECAWSFKPSALSIPLRKMEWVKAADSTSGNYWITDSATTGITKDYVLHCL